MRSKVLGVFAVILLIVVVNTFLWFNRFPNSDGHDIVKIAISDSKGKVISDWFIDPNIKWWLMPPYERRTKRAMQQVLNAFEETRKVERNQMDPDYWIQIQPKSGNSMDKLVWLKKGMAATFVNGTLGEPLTMTQAYSIPDYERDKLLKLIGE
ncbi:hypothetical protein [Brevibacillus sp. 179-C9.3 HS]|uniref:hypothetical protein n=1 Tax=unclassified Brevibacillus TaxID=2684853 RepID=UPI00399FC754